MLSRRGDGPGLVEANGTVAPGLGARGQVAQFPPEAHPAPGGTARQTALGGDPRRGRLGPVGRPLLPHLEGGRRLGDEGLETRQLPVQLLDGGAVAVVGRIRRDECLERLGEVVQLHVSMEARGCDNGAS